MTHDTDAEWDKELEALMPFPSAETLAAPFIDGITRLVGIGDVVSVADVESGRNVEDREFRAKMREIVTTLVRAADLVGAWASSCSVGGTAGEDARNAILAVVNIDVLRTSLDDLDARDIAYRNDA